MNGLERCGVCKYIQGNIICPLTKEVLPFVRTYMAFEDIMLWEINQTEKGHIPYGLIYIWNLKRKKTHIHRYRGQR